MQKHRKGFTLIEILIVCAVMGLTIIALLQVFISSLNLTIQAKETSIAIDDLKDTLEKIKNVPFSDLSTTFPDGNSINQNIIGGFSLQGESIVIRYPSGTTADPLHIRAQINWTGKDKRPYLQTINTIRTRGL